MKKILLALVAGLATLVGVLLVRTLRLESRQIEVEPVTGVSVDAGSVAEHLAGVVRFRTISYQDSALFEGDEFLRFHAYLEDIFPGVHSALSREIVGDYSLLYRWDGADTSLRPLLLMAHIDVVPVEPGTESDWTYPAFDGRVAEGYVWGRGALDDKSCLITILEAVEALLQQGFQPRRSVYLAFGHDEEVGGRQGAARIAELLASRGVELEFVLDEGGVIADMVPGIDSLVALLGLAEKGFLSLELSVRMEGGHSSMAPMQTAVGVISTAVHRLETHPVPGGIRGATAAMVDYLGPEMPFLGRLFIANRWLFGKLVERQFAASPEGNAMVRTTTAPTTFQAGVKENVLPSSARAVVNFRVLPGDSTAGVIEHVRRTVADPRVEITTLGFRSEPSPMSDVESPSFRFLERTIRQVLPGVIVAPSLVIGGTDSRYFVGLAEDVYRFMPFTVGADDLKRVHGTNERIPVDGCADMVRFYVQLLRNSAG
jgi:carboxypeptidase PM20D1